MSAGSIRLGATIDGNDAALIDRVVPLVDVVEVTPDRWASFPRGQPPRIEAPALAALSGIAARRMLNHSGLSRIWALAPPQPAEAFSDRGIPVGAEG